MEEKEILEIPGDYLGSKIKTSEITLHTQINIWVRESFFGRIFRVEGSTIVTQPGIDRT